VRQDDRQGASATLANFVAAASWTDVAGQSHEAKRSILNFFATALGSAFDPAVTAALKTLSPFSGAATSAIIGRPERLDALGAAFVNAISANLLDFDDTHLDTIIHPAAPVAAPVLALAQATPQAKPTPTPTPEVKVVEYAALTPAESKEGRELLKQVEKLNQRIQLAQKIIDQAEGSAEVLLLAYRERDRVQLEMKEQETKNNQWLARVQSRTGCIDCGLFDYEKGILKKRQDSLPLLDEMKK